MKCTKDSPLQIENSDAPTGLSFLIERLAPTGPPFMSPPNKPISHVREGASCPPPKKERKTTGEPTSHTIVI